MSTSARDALVRLLVSRYPDLRRRLAGRLGSADLANDALQDTYVRLRRTENLGEIRNPAAYLFRMAMNIASNRRRDESRHLSTIEAEKLLEIPDEAPTPQQIIEARSVLAAVERALLQLPERRRAIFRRAWVDGIKHEFIAKEFDVSVRTIRHELQLATKHLHHVTQEIGVAELQLRLSQVSSQ